MIGFEILNLEHRLDRKYCLLGNLITQGVPYENITFHKAIYGADYPDAKSVCDAAVADGFPAFSEGCEMGGRADAAYHWGLMRILKHIASEAYPFELAYFNQDDRLLPRDLSFQDLSDIGKMLLHADSNFSFLQLGWDHTFFGIPNVSLDTKDNFLVLCNRLFYKGIFAKGDSGLLMSKNGARVLMDKFSKTKKWFETLVLEDGNVEGAYTLWQPIHTGNLLNPKYLENDREDREQANDPSFAPPYSKPAHKLSIMQAFETADTDKERAHRYGSFYELLLTTLYYENSQQPLKILELGVEKGNSMRMFAAMPIVEKYVGVDGSKAFDFELPKNCDFIKADAYLDDTLQIIQAKHGAFDLVIDDASHHEKDFCVFFKKYPPLAKDNGFLVYEELNPQWQSIDNLRKQGVKFTDFRFTRRSKEEDDLEYIEGGMNMNSVIAHKRIHHGN